MGIRIKATTVTLGSALLFTSALPAFAMDAAAPKPVTGISMPVKMPVGKEDPSAIANAKITREEAVSIARKLLEIGEEYTLAGVHFNSGLQGYPMKEATSWNINFVQRVQEREIGYVNVSIHGDSGKLLSFHRYSNNPDKRPVYPPKVDFKQARVIGEEFLRKLNPKEMDSVRYNSTAEDSFRTPLQGDIRYQVRFDRVVNKVPFPMNSLMVEVDSEGQIVGYHMEWQEELQFEEFGEVLKEQAAVDAILKESSLIMSYLTPYESKYSSKPRQPIISYQWFPQMIDAKTGKTVSRDGYIRPMVSKEPVSAKPLAEVVIREKGITKEEAVKAVTDVFPLPQGAKLEEASYNEYMNPWSESEAAWNIRWSLPMDEKAGGASDKDKIMPMPYPAGKHIHANVNARTGEIRNYNMNDYGMYARAGDSKSYKVTQEAALEKAIALVRKAVPARTHQLFLEAQDMSHIPEPKRSEMPAYPFLFKRIIDGVQTSYESVNVTIDRVTGEVSNFGSSISNFPYPEKKPETISADKALELWMERHKVELQYTLLGDNGGGVIPYGMMSDKYKLMVASGEIRPDMMPATEGAPAPKGKLVYAPVQKVMWWGKEPVLDAVSGKWRDMRNGEEIELDQKPITDITGHWAERELRLMAEYQAISVKDGKAAPDQAATRGEMIKMLLIAMNGGHFSPYFDSSRKASYSDVAADSEYFGYVESAVDRNLLDRTGGTFNPDKPMNREELAELLIRALGYNQLAKTPGLFVLPVTDAEDVQLKGQVAMALGLGLLTASEDGRFAPAGEVSRAQAAAAFFRYLEKRAALQEYHGFK